MPSGSRLTALTPMLHQTPPFMQRRKTFQKGEEHCSFANPHLIREGISKLRAHFSVGISGTFLALPPA